MTRLRTRLLCLAVSLLLASVTASAWAQSNGRQGERSGAPAQARAQQGDQGHEGGHDHDRELSDAVRRVVREQRGRVLSAERVQYEGREVNRIKVIDDQGRVRVYVDDPHRNDRRERSADAP